VQKDRCKYTFKLLWSGHCTYCGGFRCFVTGGRSPLWTLRWINFCVVLADIAIKFDLGQKITFLVPVMVKYCSWTSHHVQLVGIVQYFISNNLSAGKTQSVSLHYYAISFYVILYWNLSYNDMVLLIPVVCMLYPQRSKLTSLTSSSRNSHTQFSTERMCNRIALCSCELWSLLETFTSFQTIEIG
jgi:hypothetical protein